jgi:hypothetical protein
MDNTININASFNLVELREQIEKATKIEDGEQFFESLSEVYKIKAEIGAIMDQITSIEADAKGLINTKAKALYGNEWQAISGEKFKITRSRTGDVYTITGQAPPRFVKIKKTVDSKAVDNYVAEKGKLPTGIEINDQRGESIRVTLK